jgi:hypothetical protein
MTSLTFYGGVNEIGGNNILLGKGYVKKKVSVRDARQKIYEISKIE